jgi:peptide/nickel transport system ATP-binding protein
MSQTDTSTQAGTTATQAGTPVAPESSDPVLEIRNLSVDYGFGDDPTHVLREVSLTLNRGEVLGLAGESGCGKSTLAYAATRLLSPPGLITGGEVWLTGRDGKRADLLSLSDAELRAARWRDIAIVFQGAMSWRSTRNTGLRPGSGRRSCCGWSASRRTGCGPTRTSSPAACGSAS